MGNYVVQSGSVRKIVQADDARKAALWTVHLAMEHQLPAGDGLESSSLHEGRLGRNIRVLRADGLEAGCWPIYEILVEWNQLLVALRRLKRCSTRTQRRPVRKIQPMPEALPMPEAHRPWIRRTIAIIDSVQWSRYQPQNRWSQPGHRRGNSKPLRRLSIPIPENFRGRRYGATT